MSYFYIQWDSMPMLIKYDEGVSYLPIFESADEAKSFAKEKKVQGEVTIENFSFNVFKSVDAHARRSGCMVFVYPMSKGTNDASVCVPF